jgi:hypothetical protein
VGFVTCLTRGVFKGIDGVEIIPRNKYLRINPLAQYDIRSDKPFFERVGTGPTLQTGHSLIVSQHSEPIEEGAVQPPLPRPMDVVRPAGEPPHSWNLVPSTEGASCKDGAVLSKVNIACPPAQSGARVVARQQAATLAQSGVSTVEDITCPPAQSGARVVARQQAATLSQSGVSTVEETRSPRKRGA